VNSFERFFVGQGDLTIKALSQQEANRKTVKVSETNGTAVPAVYFSANLARTADANKHPCLSRWTDLGTFSAVRTD
jgi:hypothetical protein